MNAHDPRLAQIQRWMQSVIMHPEGVDAIGTGETRAHVDIGPENLESVIARSRALSSVERLEIYVDAYYERLLECLREEFPATRRALGDELFHALAFGYLQRYPSHSYTLNRLGDHFAVFLAETRLHQGEIPPGAPPSWPDFVVELARFEGTLREVFDGPGIERSPAAFDPGTIDEIGAESWQSMRLRAAPCLRVRQHEHPVHEYWNAMKSAAHPSPPAARPTQLAIHRRDYSVRLYELDVDQFRMLEALISGLSLHEAIARFVDASPSSPQVLESRLRDWFAGWMAEGFFVAVDSE